MADTRSPVGVRPPADAVFVDGRWQPAGGGRIDVVDPTTELVLGQCLDADPRAVDLAVDAAVRADRDGGWRRLGLAGRIEVVQRLMAAVAERAEELADLQTGQMGVPLPIARVLVAGAGRMAATYAAAAEQIVQQYLRRDSVGQSLVVREPVGVVAVVIPWNGPVSSLASKVLPPLLMGCPVVVKPAPETPWEAGLFAELATAAGVPDGVLGVVTGGAATGEALVGHPAVAKVSFTGSTTAGRRVGEICAGRFARVSLELGGKSAGIVLPDADLASAVPELVNGNFFNTGQICVALSRVLVPRERHDELLDALLAEGSRRVVGDPRAEGTQIGPLVSARHRQRVEAHVARARSDGARVVLGGGRPAGLDRGWFVEPTVLDGVTNDMAIAREEVFGPVMSVLTYRDEEEAIAIANDSELGLHGAVFGADPRHALDVARRISTGSVGVNTANLTPGTPYGGVRSSGIGREHGREGLESFLELHSYVLPADVAAELEAAGTPVA